jgi:succinoglycan biosynthesis transport protein ExoP
MRAARSNEFSSVCAARIDRPKFTPNVVRAHSPSEQTMDRDLHFVQLACILRRRSRLILTVAAVGAMLAAAVGLLIPPKYTATAQIVVEPQQVDFVDGLAAATRATDESAIDTQVTMLSSRDHLRRVIEDLSRGREFRAAPKAEADPDPLASRPAGDMPSQPTGGEGLAASSASPAGLSNEGELVRRLKVWFGAPFTARNAAARELDELERQLKVMQERRSRVISVSFTATSPERAATVVNRIVELHVGRQTEERRAQTSQELNRIGERVAEIEAEGERTGEAMQTILEQRLGSGLGAGKGASSLRELEREVAGNGQTYTGLLRRQMEIREQQANIAPDARILSLATPPDRPSSPNPILFVFPALIVFSIGGSLLAVVRERLDRGLRCERDVVDALGIPCIGLVPQLPRCDLARPYHCVLNKPFAAYSEAIRSAVAALQLAATQHAPMTVLISSSVPGEGKTTLAAGIAVYAAHLGRRVLLVDFDFRHPSDLRQLHGKTDRFVEDLRDRPPTGLIHRLRDLNLDYLPMPRSSVDPLALFAGGHVQILMRQLRESYDCVFIDSPPLLGVTEARLLAPLADKCLFVIKWDSTKREVAQKALNLLDHPLRTEKGCALEISAVITQVNLKKHAAYRYGDVAETPAKYSKCNFESAGG